METVQTLCQVMELIAPSIHAADWDHVGLLVGRREAEMASVMITIDLTSDVLVEAVAAGVDAIVAYHPPIFEPLQRLDDSSETSRLMLGLISAGIAVYSPHTALDAARDGMTEWLAAGMGMGHCRPLEFASMLRPGETNQVVTYVPPDHVDAVREVMADAGAGIIGDYTSCSTVIDNAGTFFAGAASRPTTGSQGQLEHVREKRLMMVCSPAALPGVLEALRRTHPYEEPPVHVTTLARQPIHDVGMGRLVQLDTPQSTGAIVEGIKTQLGVDHVRVGRGGPEQHILVACCPGAGGSLLNAARAAGASLFLTGEMRHHDLLAAEAEGMTVLLAGHSHTERGYLPILRDRLATELPGVEVLVSAADRAPWSLA